MGSSPFLIIDFDSTFVSVETLDELAQIALADHPAKDKILRKIKEITKRGMEGKLDFPTSLRKRLTLFKANKHHIDTLIVFLKNHITPSVMRNKNFFLENNKRIYIISGGFIEYIWPIVKEFGVFEDHILANRFTFNKKKDIIGFDKNSPLAKPSGKARAVSTLGLSGEICVIGDGYTDFEIKKKGSAQKFIAFSENVNRPVVNILADKVVSNFDEIVK